MRRKMTENKMSKKQMMRKKQRNKRIVMFIVGLLIVAVVWTGILLVLNKLQSKKKDSGAAAPTQQAAVDAAETPEAGETPEAEVTDTQAATPTPEPLPNVDLSGIDSKSGILVRISDGSVAAEKDADARIYPASMTKIMTAIIGIENLTDMNELITIDQETFNRLYLDEASMAGFVPGDQVKAIDALYGVLLPSGAECCLGLAEHLFGSEAAFVEKMNEKAQELGMTNTHFVTSTGLHDEQHYTTVRDLTKLLTYALQNETFRTIYSAHDYTTSPTASSPEGLTFQSTMFKKLDTAAVTGGEIEGGKTGYTSEAGQCLASLAVVDETEYILVTAGAQGSPSTEPYHIMDAVSVYNQIGGAVSTGDTVPDASQPEDGTTTDSAAADTSAAGTETSVGFDESAGSAAETDAALQGN
jgi:D-alanyl-D-alanine carboxypeptidase (penicillin-binding protein 5/6)